MLAIQGGFRAHCDAVADLGAEPVEVRLRADLEDLDAVIIPGGESSTIAMGLGRDGLANELAVWAESGRPILATCAGMILLGRSHLGLLDIETRRNAFGRQVDSFEAELDIPDLGPPSLRAVFIRAPSIVRVGPGIEVLAEYEGRPVGVVQGSITAVSFHPELTPDRRLHRRLLA